MYEGHERYEKEPNSYSFDCVQKKNKEEGWFKRKGKGGLREIQEIQNLRETQEIVRVFNFVS